MAWNLFISYDLLDPGGTFPQVKAAIQALGQSYQLQPTLFYVHSSVAPDKARAAVAAHLHPGDRLAVIIGKGAWLDLDAPLNAINAIWSQP